MALLKCPDCGTDVSSLAGACPKCGRPTRKIPPPSPFIQSRPEAAPPEMPAGVPRPWSLETFLPRSQLGQGLWGGFFTLVLLGSVTWYFVGGRSKKAECEAILMDLNRAAGANDWEVVRSGIPRAKAICAGSRAADVAALETVELRTRAKDVADAQDRAAVIAKMDAAARVWKAYENLPTSKRTTESLKIAMGEAETHAQGLNPHDARAMREANSVLARKNMAPLIDPEALATGDKFTVLVPSPDAAKCMIWASQWSQEQDAMQQIGFRKIHCEGYSYVSKLTGERVREPGRDWIVEEH